jgi:predicted RNase H-like HicB family nuclease
MQQQERIPMARLEEYTIVIRPDDNGTFVAYVPAISSCHAWGHTPEEARSELVHVFEMIQTEYAQEGRPLPADVELTIAHGR